MNPRFKKRKVCSKLAASTTYVICGSAILRVAAKHRFAIYLCFYSCCDSNYPLADGPGSEDIRYRRQLRYVRMTVAIHRHSDA